jgi:tol-pal system protein YbgF
MMTLRCAAAGLVVALVFPMSAEAANKEHQQIMAELRMLQEQQQQLQQLLGNLADTLQTVTSQIDGQTVTMQKAFADQNLVVNNIGEAVRILREKADDTNVRLSSMTQEIQSMRQTLAAMPVVSPMLPADAGAAADPNAPAPSVAANATAPPPNVSPTRMYDQAYADYTAGQFDLAVLGFDAFIRTFPTSPNADEAQLYIGYSEYSAGKNKEAIEALRKVISDYPQSNSVSAAYYKLGLTFEALKQPDQAQQSFETVVKDYPGSYDAVLAQQALDRLKRRQDEPDQEDQHGNDQGEDDQHA